MLTVEQARTCILRYCEPLPAEIIPLSSAALGHVLAESVASDLDMPPFDKALMDGYALRSADLVDGQACLLVVDEVAAGQTPTRSLASGQATRIMTGAPLPTGADAVVPVELTRLNSEGKVEVTNARLNPGANILRRGEEMRAGEMVLDCGTVLRALEFGVLASVGRSAVRQIPAPRVAILVTGDELIEGPMLPGPGQIRNSNAPMLQAQVVQAGGMPRNLGIGRDRMESLTPLIDEGLNTAEILVLSGGVSAGQRDLVPEALHRAGVVPHFQKVQVKPGKPLYFGTVERGGRKCLVFGLPGNPVSSFVCFELFVRPAIRTLAGFSIIDLPRIQVALQVDHHHQSDRPTYHPADLKETSHGWTANPLEWKGSADLRGMLRASGLLVLPAGEYSWPAGQRLEALRFDV